MKERAVIGLSGGVDSSVAAYLLKKQGYDVVALFMINWHERTGAVTSACTWEEDALIAEMVAKKLDIPFHIVDLSEDYKRRVADYMFAEYQAGRTPNPDVLCNREIKFDTFMEEAVKLGADFTATGHYCRKSEIEVEGKTIYRLLAGKDPNKDSDWTFKGLKWKDSLLNFGLTFTPIEGLVIGAGISGLPAIDLEGMTINVGSAGGYNIIGNYTLTVSYKF